MRPPDPAPSPPADSEDAPAALAAALGTLALLRPHAPALLLGTLCLVLLAGSTALYAYLTGPLIRLLLSGGAEGLGMLRPLLGLLPLPAPGHGPAALPAVALLLVLLAAVKGLSGLGSALLLDGTAERVGHALRAGLYRRLLRLPLAVHRRHFGGDLLARLLEDVRRVQEATVGAGLALLREGLGAVALLAVALSTAPKLALVAALALPLLALSTGLISRGVKGAAARESRALGRMAAGASGGLAALRELKSCGAEARQATTVTGWSRQALRWARRRIGVRALSPLCNELMAAAALGLTLVYAGGAVARGTLDPERLVTFFVAAVMMYRPIKGLGNAAQQRAAGRASLERVGALWGAAAEAELSAEQARAVLPDPGAEVTLRGVRFAYEPGGPEVLRGAALTLRRGRLTAVAGASGAGKTTLISLLCGLEQPGAGSLCWDGVEHEAWPGAALRGRASLVPQQPLLLDGTVAENLRLGAPDAADGELRAAAERAGIWQRLARNAPLTATGDPLETVLGPEGEQLSAGETQRLALARALLRQTPLLVLDEPSSALDRQNEALLIQTLRRAAEDHAVLVVAHSEALLVAADEVWTLEGGTLTRF